MKGWVWQDWFLINEVNLTAVLNLSGTDHQENMSVKCIPRHPPFCIAGIYLFFIFSSKTYIVCNRYSRLGEAVLTCTNKVCFERTF